LAWYDYCIKDNTGGQPMSTHCTIKFVVRGNHPDDADQADECRLLQYADGYTDFVEPLLAQVLEAAAEGAEIVEDITAASLAATYESLADMGLPRHASSLTRRVGARTLQNQAGVYQYLLEVDVDQANDTFKGRVIGPSALW
jgi:hypothetical protein